MEKLDNFAYEIIKEINFARTKPKKYANYLEEIKQYFDENILIIPEESIKIETNEGVAVYDEAIDYLNNISPLPKLELHSSLLKISNDYLKYALKMDYNKIFTLEINNFIEKYGSFNGELTKLMEFGGLTPERIVTNLIVCDGEYSRDYRNLLFDKYFKYIGVASGPHENFNQFTVVLISDSFISLEPKNDIPVQLSNKDNEEEEEEEEEEKDKEDKKEEKEKKIKEKKEKKIEEEEEEEEDEKEDDEKKVNNDKSKQIKEKIDYNNDIREEGVKSIKKIEKIKNINGKFVKIIQIIKTMEDGLIETETFKEII